jgi:hypothetical protein
VAGVVLVHGASHGPPPLVVDLLTELVMEG